MTDLAYRQDEDKLLMAKVGRGDTAALETLYYAYRPRLHRFLLALGCPEADLDELCNETFFVVWRRANTFDGSSRLSTWIFGIARNKALDLLRRTRRLRLREADVELEALPETRLGDGDRMELRQTLEAALDALPADQRAVVELAFLDGMSYQEIAAVMHCPEGTVKTRMFHARRRLRQRLPEYGLAWNRRNST